MFLTKTICIALCIALTCVESTAQVKLNRLELQATGSLNLFGYNSKGAVLNTRRDKIGFGDDVTVSLALHLQTKKDKRLYLGAGLSYGERYVYMNRFREGTYTNIDLPGLPDTQYMRQIVMRGKYLSVPLILSYNLSKKDFTPVSAFIGLRLINSFKTSARTDLQADPVRFAATASQLAQMDEFYQSSFRNYTLRAQPFFDIEFRIRQRIGLRWGIIPFQLDMINATPKLSGPSLGIAGTMSIQYLLNY